MPDHVTNACRNALDDGFVNWQARELMSRESGGADARIAARAGASCEDSRVDLALLHEVAAERRGRWEAAGLRWVVVDGPLTEKPAAWLILENDTDLGQLTVWFSGEAEMEWGTPERGGERHYDLDSSGALSACVTDLERAVGFN